MSTLVLVLLSCGGEAKLAPAPVPSAPPRPAAPPVPMATALPSAEPSDGGAPTSSEPESPEAEAAVCPADMAYVDTTYCPKPELHCLESEYDKPNHLTICKRFAPGQKCLVPERRQRFCVDRHEYPSQPGAHPPVMVDWYDAEAMCEEKSKRLCFQSEWEAACEGPEKLPFPYGLERDATACNIDRPWIEPTKRHGQFLMYSPDAAAQDAELRRLDESVPSGSKERCVSGFGVHDLTGNLDEWVISEEHRGKSKWAGLKGGAWGHVRNACRPMTTSHVPEFTYYFVSFRCCADARGPAEPGEWKHPPVPAKKKPGPLGRGWPASK
jgi:hypothetical protein